MQHELLPRLSAEVTYNRRKKDNQRVTDLILAGCDLYSAIPADALTRSSACRSVRTTRATYYDFYGIQAPVDPRLPGGGGYFIEGIATAKEGVTITNAGVNAVTIAPKGTRSDFWSGIDTNFVLRASRGLRVSGGTEHGSAQ